MSRILLIEDSKEVGVMVVRQLEKRGHSVAWATSIADAIELVARAAGPIEVVVVDRQLGDGDGWSWVAGQTFPRVVRMTATPPDDGGEQAKAGFFHKGWDHPKRLVELIEGSP